MYKKNWRFFFFIPFALFAQEERSEKSFSVKPNGWLELKADFGTVEVRSSWAQNEVKVEVLKWVEGRHRRSIKELFEDYEIRDLNGEVLAKTNGGSLTLGRIEGPVNAETSGGSIDLRQAKGKLFGRTSGGGITVGAVSGDVDVETSGGSMEAEILKQLNAPCELSTSGGILIYLSRDLKADIDAYTSGGEVDCDLPVTIQGKFGDGKLRGKLNGGGPLLTLRTSGGDIELRSR